MTNTYGLLSPLTIAPSAATAGAGEFKVATALNANATIDLTNLNTTSLQGLMIVFSFANAITTQNVDVKIETSKTSGGTYGEISDVLYKKFQSNCTVLDKNVSAAELKQANNALKIQLLDFDSQQAYQMDKPFIKVTITAKSANFANVILEARSFTKNSLGLGNFKFST